jgi:hypothetical protein
MKCTEIQNFFFTFCKNVHFDNFSNETNILFLTATQDNSIRVRDKKVTYKSSLNIYFT